MRVSRTIGVPPTMSARLAGMREFSLPFGTWRRLSTHPEAAACELVCGGERRHRGRLRFLQQRAHRVLDAGSALAGLGCLVAVQLERHVDDPAGVRYEVGRVE